MERRAELSSLPRATVVSLRSMELIRSWGVEDAVLAGGVDVEWHGWQSHTLATVAEGSMWPTGIPTREQAALLSPTAPACVPQDHLEPRAAGAPARAGWRSRAPPHRGGGRRGPARGCRGRSPRHPERRPPHRPRPLPGRRGRRAQPRSERRSASPCLGPTGSLTSSLRPSGRRCGRSSATTATASTASATAEGEGSFLPAGRDDRWIYGARVDPRERRGLHARAARAAHPRRCRNRRPRGLDRAHAAPSASRLNWPTAFAPATSSSPATPPTGSPLAAAPG